MTKAWTAWSNGSSRRVTARLDLGFAMIAYKLAVPAWHASGKKCVALALPLHVRQRDANVAGAVEWDGSTGMRDVRDFNLLTMEMA